MSKLGGAKTEHIPVKDKLGGNRGWLKFTQTGWRFYDQSELMRTEPIGDPLRTFVMSEGEAKSYFGETATFDGWEVVL